MQLGKRKLNWEEMSCPCCFRPGAPLCEDFAPADIAAKLAGMRSLLKAHSLGGYLIPSGDAHSSEYVSETDKRREWLTGFTGSAGIALVTADKALVWTDGRYFLQAAQQLAGTEWELMRMNEPGVPELEEWVKAHQASLGGPIGADPRLVTLDFAAEWQQKGCAELALVATWSNLSPQPPEPHLSYRWPQPSPIAPRALAPHLTSPAPSPPPPPSPSTPPSPSPSPPPSSRTRAGGREPRGHGVDQAAADRVLPARGTSARLLGRARRRQG